MTEIDGDVFKGLKTLFVSSFPKRCSTCGKIYPTFKDFLMETKDLQDHSGLRQSADDSDRSIVEIFRNCSCGSTLMDVCLDRRDLSDPGQDRRRQFDQLLNQLESMGIERAVAKHELRLFLSGKKSELLEKLHFEQVRLKNGNPPPSK